MDNLKILREKDEFYDLFLDDDISRIGVHSCILACYSKVINGILQAQLDAKKDWSILNPLIIMLGDDSEIKTKDSKQSVIEELIMFIYGEPVFINIDQIPELQRLTLLLGVEINFEVIANNATDYSEGVCISENGKFPKLITSSDDLDPFEISTGSTTITNVNDSSIESLTPDQTINKFKSNEVSLSDFHYPFNIPKETNQNTKESDPLIATKCLIDSVKRKRSKKIKKRINILSKKEKNNSHYNEISLDECSDLVNGINSLFDEDSYKSDFINLNINSHSGEPYIMDENKTAPVKNSHKNAQSYKESSIVTQNTVSFCQNNSSNKNLNCSNPSKLHDNLEPISLSSPVNIENLPHQIITNKDEKCITQEVLNTCKEPEDSDNLEKCLQSSKIFQVEDDLSVNKIVNSYKAVTSTFKKSVKRQSLSCVVCNSSFHKGRDLVQHILTEEHFSQLCSLCMIQLDNWNDLRAHYLLHNNPLPYFCFGCELRFRTRGGLDMHLPKHSNTKPYTCNECGRGFKWRHAAQAHAITHQNQGHLLCDICGFSSKYMTTFKCHIQRHYDQFYPCPHPGCNFKSYRKTHLNEHVASHSKLRPHQCDVCGRSFSLAKNLNRHLKLHTPDSFSLDCNSISGEDCTFQTTRPDKLRFHLDKKHNIKSFKMNKSIPFNVSAQSLITESTNTILKENSNCLGDFLNLPQAVQAKVKGSEEDGLLYGSHSSMAVEAMSQVVSSNSMLLDSLLLKKNDSTSSCISDELASNADVHCAYTSALPSIEESTPVIVSQSAEFTICDSDSGKSAAPAASNLSLETDKGLHLTSLSSNSSIVQDVDMRLSTDNLDQLISLPDIPIVFDTPKDEASYISTNSENPSDSNKAYTTLDSFVLSSQPSMSLQHASMQLIEIPEAAVEYLPAIEQDQIMMDQQHTIILNDDNSLKNDANILESQLSYLPSGIQVNYSSEEGADLTGLFGE